MPEIDVIKIWGERNSGTIFLERLLKANFTRTKIISSIQSGGVNDLWKHSTLTREMYTNLTSKFENEKILEIVVVRDIESWCTSMWNNPYHLYTQRPATKSMLDFLRTKITKSVMVERDPKGMSVSRDDVGRDIIEIRYHKLVHLIDYMGISPNIIVVNLDYLQNNTLSFLKNISSSFSIYQVEKPIVNIKHTKCGRMIKNRNYAGVGGDDYEISLRYIRGRTDKNIENRIPKVFFKRNNVVLMSG